VLCAATANAAAAVGEERRLGAISVGHDADLVLLDVAGVDEWMYCPGRDLVRAVIKRGTIAYQRQ
jgi:imidazolonepropionase-like amidohydrolase